MKRVPGSRTRRPVARPGGRSLANKPAGSCGFGSAGLLLRTRLRAGPTAGAPRLGPPCLPARDAAGLGSGPARPGPTAALRPGRPRGSGLGRRPGRRACGSFRAPHPSLAARSGAGPTGRPSAPSAVPASRLRPSLRGGGAAPQPQAPPPRAAGSAGRRGRARSLSGPAAGRRGGLAVRPRGRGGGAALRSGRGDGEAGRPLPQAGGGRTALPASRPRVGAA